MRNSKITMKNQEEKVVEYKMDRSNELKREKIMSTQPKSAGKYYSWLNTRRKNEDPVSINSDQVDIWQELPPEKDEQNQNQEHVILFMSEQGQGKDIIDAKNKEIENIKNHEVWMPDLYKSEMYIKQDEW